MTILDTTIPAKVVEILATYGKSITFIEDAAQSYDPATGTTSSSPTNRAALSAPPYQYQRQFVNGDTIREGDARLLIAPPSGWSPVTGQKVTFDSTTWRIVAINPIYSGNSIAAYEVQIRQ